MATPVSPARRAALEDQRRRVRWALDAAYGLIDGYAPPRAAALFLGNAVINAIQSGQRLEKFLQLGPVRGSHRTVKAVLAELEDTNPDASQAQVSAPHRR